MMLRIRFVVLTLMLVAAGSCGYAGELDARRPGQWELRFDVRAGSSHFTHVARVDASIGR